MIRYNKTFLEKFSKENNFDVIETYNKIDKFDDKKSSKPGPKPSGINRDTRIVGKCKYNNCDEKFDTAFRDLYEHKSLYCKDHKSIIANEKRVETIRKEHGVDNITQVNEIKDKIKETNIDKYGATTPLQSPEIKEDIKNKHLQNFGGTNPSQNPNVQVKKKQNKLDNGNIKYKGDYLKLLLDNCDAILQQEYKDIILSRDTDILFKCKCGINNTKSFRNIENYGAYCEDCNCKNKTEEILKDFLKSNYPITFQFKQEWCKNIRYLPFDFCIEELKVIIELDGPQHFGKVKKWISLEDANKRDRYKMKCANDNGFSVIRIVQEDVWDNKYDWKKEILENIEKIKNEGKVQNVFMCKNSEYDIFN
jgi:very-short-patch-repair endonuclease